MSKKYCIYKKPNGDIEAWEYIDDIDYAASFWYIKYAMDKYGVEDVMPICMNDMGGYHTFNKEQCIAIIESDTWPTLSSHYDLFKGTVNNEQFDYGWIDLLGNTYMCKYMQHASLAHELVLMNYKQEYSMTDYIKNNINAPDEFLLEKGWIKVLKGNPSHIYYDRVVTKVALEKLLEVEQKDDNQRAKS